MPKSRKTTKGLNDRQLKFCREYIIDMNGSQAAIRAGYSPKCSKETASELLTYANVQSVIKELQEKQAWKADVTAERVIRELSSIAFGKATDIIEVRDGVVYVANTEELPEEQKRMISEISQGKEGEIKIKMHDKVQALEKLCKHLGIFVHKVEVTKVKKVVGYKKMKDED